MEGKAALFWHLAGISGVPILIDEADPDRVVDVVAAIAPGFGAIQLEDIAAPACFAIEDELVRRLDRPVLHDDQHGTAVVTLAALLRASEQVGRPLEDSVVGQIGLGAAGLGVARLLLRRGVRELLGTDVDDRALPRLESIGGRRSTLEEILRVADVVIATTGRRNLIPPSAVRPGQILLALTNPDPEIEPVVALYEDFRRAEVFARFTADTMDNVSFPRSGTLSTLEWRSSQTGLLTDSDFEQMLVSAAHARLGFDGGAGVQVGEYSALPHGSIQPQVVREGSILLIDGGCSVEGYSSDISRTFVLGKPTDKMKRVFEIERRAQDAALAAARPGVPCEAVDAAARKVIVDAGFGPDYKFFTHRVGHGMGMDGHEWPYLVRGNTLPLAPGMTFSDEPGIYIRGEFGVRLEDDMYITADGAKLFTPQSNSLEKPF